MERRPEESSKRTGVRELDQIANILQETANRIRCENKREHTRLKVQQKLRIGAKLKAEAGKSH